MTRDNHFGAMTFIEDSDLMESGVNKSAKRYNAGLERRHVGDGRGACERKTRDRCRCPLEGLVILRRILHTIA